MYLGSLIDNSVLTCPAYFDGWSCWPETPAGSVANQSYTVYYKCEDDGTWYFHEPYNKTWVNYTTCVTTLCQNIDSHESVRVIRYQQRTVASLVLSTLVYSAPHHSLHVSTFDVFVDALRRLLPPYGSRLGVRIPATSVGSCHCDRLGTTSYHYCCLRTCPQCPRRRTRTRNVLVTKFEIRHYSPNTGSSYYNPELVLFDKHSQGGSTEIKKRSSERWPKWRGIQFFSASFKGDTSAGAAVGSQFPAYSFPTGRRRILGVQAQIKRKWSAVMFRPRANSCTVTTVSVRKYVRSSYPANGKDKV
ncbi:unnamed protein product [Callosobruchus maculatus]|uniref:G-protein coupled receptors family 2 profile 1 domain-containing protein n=1 Tax=Callosobruchus maculatus TaxID=64391 RepID=A0A653DNU2_CALMS|nr:unnamed protein product [Callosobruchus maculatus]